MAKRVINIEVELPNEIGTHFLEEIENWMGADVWVAANTNAECAMHHFNWMDLASQLNLIIDQAAALAATLKIRVINSRGQGWASRKAGSSCEPILGEKPPPATRARPLSASPIGGKTVKRRDWRSTCSTSPDQLSIRQTKP
jgi:hypothetical protein